MGRRPGLLLATLALLASAAAGSRVAEQELEQAVRARGLDPAEIVFPGRLTEEMRAWAHRQVEGVPGEERRLGVLLNALLDRDGKGLQYAVHANGTAEEVFATGRANCLAFTNLFVAMGREIGADVYYLQIRRRPSFDQEGDLVVVWEHVTAGYGPPNRRLALEFDIGPPVESAQSEELSDLTALAMYYSNRGAGELLAGSAEKAREWLDVAVRLDPAWSQAWLNLGVARRRSGDLAGAEEAYREAIEADARNYQAYHNLVGLLRLQGEGVAAREVLRLLDRRDNRDPFIYLSLGDESLAARRLREAERYYQRAHRLAPTEGETRAALGLLAFHQGRPRRALRWWERSRPAEGEPRGPRARQLAALLGVD
ncbi:MAG: hypothetical protein R3325_11980 [Thermoanaerobaculia bacterium]|nr:hypothetical protein [Thermoanaerobaculia bacterium]